MLWRALGIVPARYASTRFPGKLTQDLCGKPIVVRTIEAALQATTLSEVWLATDDSRISKATDKHCPHVEVVSTSPHCPSGSDRLVAALQNKGLLNDGATATGGKIPAKFPYDAIVNVQGDEPLLDPTHIDALVHCLETTPDADIATLVVPLDATTKEGAQNILNPNVVKCVVDQHNYAMYFSRAAIPCVVSNSAATIDTSGNTTYLKHVGLYAYRPQALLTFVQTKPAALEMAEKLEQLRAMALGMRIKVVHVASAEIGIDTAEQLDWARKKMKKMPNWSHTSHDEPRW